MHSCVIVYVDQYVYECERGSRVCVVYVDECVYECERGSRVCVVYVDECMYECERGSSVCVWCMWMSVCMNVREVLVCVCGVCG